MIRAQEGVMRLSPLYFPSSCRRSCSLEWWSNHNPQPSTKGTFARQSFSFTSTSPSCRSLGCANFQLSIMPASFNRAPQASPSKSDLVISLRFSPSVAMLQLPVVLQLRYLYYNKNACGFSTYFLSVYYFFKKVKTYPYSLRYID